MDNLRHLAIAQAISAELHRQERSQRWLSRRLDVSDMWVGRRLNGQVVLSDKEVIRIAEVLEIDPLLDLGFNASS